MINLPDTSTEHGQREASVLLARLMPNWEVEDLGHRVYIHIKDGGVITFARENTHEASLYDPVYMAIARRILSFVRDRYDDFNLTAKASDTIAWFFTYCGDDGIMVALNSVLQLANEAGMLDEVEA